MGCGLVDPKNFCSHVLPVEEVDKAVELVRCKQTANVTLTMHDGVKQENI